VPGPEARKIIDQHVALTLASLGGEEREGGERRQRVCD